MDVKWQMGFLTGVTYSENINIIKPPTIQGSGQGHLWGQVPNAITTKPMFLAPVARSLSST